MLPVLLFAGCQGPAKGGSETPTTTEPQAVDARGYDPLELPQDREIVPKAYPRQGRISGHPTLVETPTPETSTDTGVAVPQPPQPSVDSLNGQAYRVQLFTSKLYGEAKDAVRVAEEIFDQPVYLDYEVPYFKVRVGSFAKREDAEAYQQKAKAAGYSDAWVVMVSVGVKEVAPLYENLGPLAPGHTTEPADSTSPGDDEP